MNLVVFVARLEVTENGRVELTSLLMPGLPMKNPFMLIDRSKAGSSKMREQSCGTCDGDQQQ